MLHRRDYGFTVVELLVVIAIIALLLSILLPSTRLAREQIYALMCASNQSQKGIGFSLYATENDRMYPYHRTSNNHVGWFNLIGVYMGEHYKKAFACPSRKEWRCPGPHGLGTRHEIVLPRRVDGRPQAAHHYMPYGYNGYWLGFYTYPAGAHPTGMNYTRTSYFRSPHQLIVVGDSDLKNAGSHWAQSLWYPFRSRISEGVSGIHLGEANILFADGHVALHDDHKINRDPAFKDWWNPDPVTWKVPF